MHQIEGGIDLFQRHRVRDHAIQLDFALEVVFNIARELCAALDPAERGAFPDAARDQLKRAGADFLARAGHADDGGHALTHVAALQRLAHDLDIADAFKRVVHSAISHILDGVHHVAGDLRRVEGIGCAQRGRHGEFVRVDIDSDDPAGLGHDRTLDHRQTDPAEAEDGDCRTRLDLGSIQHRADASGDAAAQQTDLVQRRGGIDFGQGDFRDNRVFGEGRATHVVKQRCPPAGEAAGVVGHVAGPHRRGDGLAEIGFAGMAIFTVAAFRDVERDDMIAGFQTLDAGAAFDDDATAFVAKDAGKCAFRVVAREGESVGVADAGGDDLQ